jgi:mannose-6-phosphate isomerase-like protein (cupin superfamily)
MATTQQSYKVTSLDEIEPGAPNNPGAGELRQRLEVRRELGITAFGINAVRALGEGELIREHTEDGNFVSNQEELYVVLKGAATFDIDGERLEAPAGSLVYVRPEAKRSAVAEEKGTTILMIGGTPGQAYDPPPAEASEAFRAYTAGEYETALAKQLTVVEARPKDVLAHFNAGCYAAKAGRTDEALEHLRRAVELDERIKEYIAKDDDLDSLREDPRFEVLSR